MGCLRDIFKELFKRIEMKAIGKNIVIEIVDEEVKTDSGLILSGDDTNKFRYKHQESQWGSCRAHRIMPIR